MTSPAVLIVTSTVAIALVCVLRRPVRAACGARASYAMWWLVPALSAGTALPAVMPTSALLVPLRAQAVAMPAGFVGQAGSVGTNMPWLAIAWAIGALGTAAWFAARQARFVRSLGRLRPRGRVVVAEHEVGGLPASIGVWRPRIVVSPLFDVAHARHARALMVLHERIHVRSFDLQANAVALALRCVFWFNPIMHLAWALFRRDQELACDARLIAAAPRARRAYADALLSVHLVSQWLPLGCHWNAVHPLKERIMTLTAPAPSHRRRRLGLALVVGLALAGAATANGLATSAPAATQKDGQLHVVARIDGGEPIDWRGPIASGSVHHFAWPNGDGVTWTLDATLRPNDANTYVLDATVARGSDAPSHPRLVFGDGQPAGIKLGAQHADGTFEGLELSITATSGKPVAAD